jgi:TetR/AcrR family transcriptional repressor of nem operon
MARPKEFDRDQALTQAMAVFWGKGYEGTSTEDLLRAMGIGRQSMYDTFGDKRTLYLEALRRYTAESVSTFVQNLNAGGSSLAALERALVAFAWGSPEDMAKGCMGVNAMCEFGRGDSEINSLNDSSAAILAAAIERHVRDGKAKGEFRPDVGEGQAARFLIAILTGMKVNARVGATMQSLRDIARLAVTSLKAT